MHKIKLLKLPEETSARLVSRERRKKANTRRAPVDARALPLFNFHAGAFVSSPESNFEVETNSSLKAPRLGKQFLL